MALSKFDFLGGLAGGLNTLAEESRLPPNEMRRCLDCSLEDGETLKFPPGDTRLNATQINSGAAIRMLAEYNKSDGTRKRYAKAGTEIREWDLAGTISAAVLTGLTSDKVAGWAVLNDLFILCDPSGNYVTDGTVWGPLGADAPAAPTVAFAAGAGLNIGTYKYKVSRYSSTLNEESALSAAATVVTNGGNQQVAVSALTAVDAVWDKIRVYRTLVGGTAYFLQSERSTAANFTDSSTDVTVGAATPAPTTDTVKPPAAKFPIVHQNRLWLFELVGDRGAVRFSESGLPYRFPVANRITFDVKDGDPVTGAWVRAGRLYIAKPQKLFVLLGDSADSFVLQTNEVGRGARAERCTVTIGPHEYVLDMEKGPFRKGLEEGEAIGKKVLPSVRKFNASRQGNFVAGHEPTSRAWWISVTTTPGGSANDLVYAYHYERGSWAQLRLPNVGAFGDVHDSSERIRLVYGTDDGFIHLVDQDGNAIKTNIAGALSGTVVSGTATTLVTTGGLTTTGNGWKSEYLAVIFRDSSGAVTAIEQQKITSNTGSTFTTGAWATRTPASTDLWFVGAFFMDVLTGKLDLGMATLRKHIPYWYMHFKAVDHSVSLYASLVADAEGVSDAKLAGFSALQRAKQRLGFVRAGGGRRPLLVAARIVAVSSNQPQQVKGFTLMAEPSAAS